MSLSLLTHPYAKLYMSSPFLPFHNLCFFTVKTSILFRFKGQLPMHRDTRTGLISLHLVLVMKWTLELSQESLILLNRRILTGSKSGNEKDFFMITAGLHLSLDIFLKCMQVCPEYYFICRGSDMQMNKLNMPGFAYTYIHLCKDD